MFHNLLARDFCGKVCRRGQWDCTYQLILGVALDTVLFQLQVLLSLFPRQMLSVTNYAMFKGKCRLVPLYSEMGSDLHTNTLNFHNIIQLVYQATPKGMYLCSCAITWFVVHQTWPNKQWSVTSSAIVSMSFFSYKTLHNSALSPLSTTSCSGTALMKCLQSNACS